MTFTKNYIGSIICISKAEKQGNAAFVSILLKKSCMIRYMHR